VIALLVVLPLPVVGEAAIPFTCLPDPPSAVPVQPVFTLDTVAFDGGKTHLDIWRQPCLGDTGSVVLVRVTPTNPATSIGCTDLTLTQDNRNYHPVFLDVSSNRFFSLCELLHVPVTTILTALSTGEPRMPFNDLKVFTLFYLAGVQFQYVTIHGSLACHPLCRPRSASTPSAASRAHPGTCSASRSTSRTRVRPYAWS
jgi:hypothetical protein